MKWNQIDFKEECEYWQKLRNERKQTGFRTIIEITKRKRESKANKGKGPKEKLNNFRKLLEETLKYLYFNLYVISIEISTSTAFQKISKLKSFQSQIGILKDANGQIITTESKKNGKVH